MNAWTMPESVFEWLAFRAPSDFGYETIVELGSGEGSAVLANICRKLYSVEHDEKFLGQVPATTYIHAPIVSGWYDADAISKSLPDNYDLLVIDGPPGTIGRFGFVEHLAMFADVPMLFDDVQRKPEFELAVTVAKERNKNVSVHYLTDGRAFATVGWGMR